MSTRAPLGEPELPARDQLMPLLDMVEILEGRRVLAYAVHVPAITIPAHVARDMARSLRSRIQIVEAEVAVARPEARP